MEKLLNICLVLLTILLIASCGSNDKNHADKMAQEHQGDTPAQSDSIAYKQVQPVQTQTISYAQTDSGEVSGFLAQPKDASSDSTLPGVILIHEWWGLNDNIRMMEIGRASCR